MSEAVKAWGLKSPDGLTAFASYDAEGAWTLFAFLMARERESMVKAMESKGWRVVPVLISEAENGQ